VVDGDALEVGVGVGVGEGEIGVLGGDVVGGVGAGASGAWVQPNRSIGSAAARRTARLIRRPYARSARRGCWKDRAP
jgi:hypothetical protein